MLFFFFFFSSRRRHTRLTCDWSSDVCSSDLTAHRKLAGLESPASVGGEAARRTLRRLGARRAPTRECPVVFDPETAATLLRHLAGALAGPALYRRMSFLLGR